MGELNLDGLNELRDLPLWLLIVLPVILLSQATWLFLDARKRAKYPWFWGLWGLIQTPMPFILYWLIVRIDWKKIKRGKSNG
ncbi:MAG TPA: sigmaY antisigma factor component [Paenibacillus sp.]|uniref:sigmaY antisigma factor component n=1 Tax=Paenibacillus sp. TaxID=58172 RepID=UPI0028D6388A|nr:sigmaY antisigma factor component [Paenibacillus sp.]HUC93040.1 sigmaY antisigma factor component [Paenibacillus sp.]